MADIELVVKIDKELYQMCKNLHGDADCIESVIAKGIPLPKEHGRLIDENDLWFEDIDDISCVTQRNVENAPTIIEADKAESEKISDRNLKMWLDIYEEEKRRKERSEE